MEFGKSLCKIARGKLLRVEKQSRGLSLTRASTSLESQALGFVSAINHRAEVNITMKMSAFSVYF